MKYFFQIIIRFPNILLVNAIHEKGVDVPRQKISESQICEFGYKFGSTSLARWWDLEMKQNEF